MEKLQFRSFQYYYSYLGDISWLNNTVNKDISTFKIGKIKSISILNLGKPEGITISIFYYNYDGKTENKPVIKFFDNFLSTWLQIKNSSISVVNIGSNFFDMPTITGANQKYNLSYIVYYEKENTEMIQTKNFTLFNRGSPRMDLMKLTAELNDYLKNNSKNIELFKKFSINSIINENSSYEISFDIFYVPGFSNRNIQIWIGLPYDIKNFLKKNENKIDIIDVSSFVFGGAFFNYLVYYTDRIEEKTESEIASLTLDEKENIPKEIENSNGMDIFL